MFKRSTSTYYILRMAQKRKENVTTYAFWEIFRVHLQLEKIPMKDYFLLQRWKMFFFICWKFYFVFEIWVRWKKCEIFLRKSWILYENLQKLNICIRTLKDVFFFFYHCEYCFFKILEEDLNDVIKEYQRHSVFKKLIWSKNIQKWNFQNLISFEKWEF